MHIYNGLTEYNSFDKLKYFITLCFDFKRYQIYSYFVNL